MCLWTTTSGSLVISLYKTLIFDQSQSKSTWYPLLLVVLKTRRRESYRAKYFLTGRIFRCFLCSDNTIFIILMRSLNYFTANDRLIRYLIVKRSAFSPWSISLIISALKELQLCFLFSCPLCWEVEGFSRSWLVRSILPASVCFFFSNSTHNNRNYIFEDRLNNRLNSRYLPDQFLFVILFDFPKQNRWL